MSRILGGLAGAATAIIVANVPGVAGWHDIIREALIAVMTLGGAFLADLLGWARGRR